MESKWNTEGRQFKLNTTIGTVYHKSMERNLKKNTTKIFYLNANGIDLKCISFLLRDICPWSVCMSPINLHRESVPNQLAKLGLNSSTIRNVLIQFCIHIVIDKI